MSARYTITRCPGCGRMCGVNGVTDCKRPTSGSAPDDLAGLGGLRSRGDRASSRAPVPPDTWAAAPAPEGAAAH